MPATPQTGALVGLFLGAAAIAFSPILVRLVQVAPEVSAFYRVALAAPLLWIWMRRTDRKTNAPPLDWRTRLGLLGAGLFFTGDLGFWHWSLQLTSIANATLLPNFSPIFVTLGAVLLFHERISRLYLIGLVASVLGLIILMGGDPGRDPNAILGDALGLVAAVFYAGYLLAISRYRKRLSVARIMAWTSLGAALGLLPIVPLSGNAFTVPSPQDWLFLLLLAWFSHALGQGLIAYALAHLPATFSSVGLLTQPLLAALLAWPLFGEGIDQWQGIGGLIILVGIYAAHRGRAPRPANP